MPVLVYLLAVAVFAQGTSEFVLAGILPAIASDLGTSLGQAGLLTSGFALGMIVGAPSMAAVARRLPPRWTLAGFLGVFIAAHVVGAVTDSFAVLLATRILAALANAGFLAVTLSAVTRIVPTERHARAMAVILSGTTLALVAGVPVGALIGEALSWRATLWTIALLCLPTLAAILVVTPKHDRSPAASRELGDIRRELATLRSRPVQVAIAAAVLVNAATFATLTYLAALATSGTGLSEQVMPLLLATFGVGAFLGVRVAGRLGDRHWRTTIAVTGPSLAAGWIVLAVTVFDPVALWLLALIQGALSFALGTTLVTRIIAEAGDAPTMGGAFATTALNIGAVVGPVVGGVALDQLGVRGPILVSAVLVCVCVVLHHAGSRRLAERAYDSRGR
jgi:DHA1 family chloramphenicol resistance protein-like MFS transporter